MEYKIQRQISRWQVAKSSLIRIFLHHNEYSDSKWADWEYRIKQGQKAVEQNISKSLKKLKVPKDDYLPDWLAEDHIRACDLTNAMYAALVVSIWAEMEYFLKSLIRTCFSILEKKKKILEKTSKFCSDALTSSSVDKEALSNCIKELKDLQAGVPYDYKDIEDFFKKEFNIKLDSFKNYKIINAIRILNNSFKHTNGRYEPTDKPYTKIDQKLLDKWGIFEDRKDFDYSKLPIENLVSVCNAFCHDLLDKVEQNLDETSKRLK